MELIAKNVGVNRGERRIVRDVSFALASGNALIVTGENGSGKSTLLRAIAGLLPLATGSIELAGEGTGDCPLRELVHYLGHQNAMKGALTVRENLAFWQEFCGDPWMDVEEALEQVNLVHAIDLPFSYLSAGMKRRASIARLLVSEKPVWIVDEPTAALDAASSKLFAEIARDYCGIGGMLIAATHLPLGIEGAQTLHLEVNKDSYADDMMGSPVPEPDA